MTTIITTRPSTIPASLSQSTQPESSWRVLAGMLPVRPFHPEGFFGQVIADGQHSRVSALACCEGKPILLSLIGHDISVSAAFAALWSKQSIAFEVGEETSWSGPTLLSRRDEGYKQFAAALPGTRAVHCVSLSQLVHIAEGLLHPPSMRPPETEEERKTRMAKPRGAQRDTEASTQGKELVPQGGPRFVLGNWDEETPNQRSFLANVYAMRVIFLQRDSTHPELVDQWASALWKHGLRRRLIEPLPALGVKAWALTGTTATWNALVHDGLRQGWLPWRAEEVQVLLDSWPAA
ncbi:MAG: hypothetical protein ABI413_14710 [Ktedonobacteraceae bacterium]